MARSISQSARRPRSFSGNLAATRILRSCAAVYYDHMRHNTPESAWEPSSIVYWAFWLVFASIAFVFILPTAWIVQKFAQRSRHRALSRANAQIATSGDGDVAVVKDR
jgi:hypothetical protein